LRRPIAGKNPEDEMAHGNVWPAHPKPLPDELLSSWIVRVAAANAIKLQTLSWMQFGNERSPWNRDIDRNVPRWLIKALSQHTGTNYWEVFHTTLATYRTRLYPHRQAVGQLRWILPIRSYGMRRRAFGLQFCPECLATDAIPYFRKQWRVALFTYCPVHKVMLHDSCPGCGEPVVIFRGDFGRELVDAKPMHVCHLCGLDFRMSTMASSYFPSKEIGELFGEMLNSLQAPLGKTEHFDVGFFSILHQFCRVMGSHQNAGRLEEFVANRLCMEKTDIDLGRTAIEHRRVAVRHELLLCALWLVSAPTGRIREAWEGRAIRYNLMLKDMEEMPMWFRQLAKCFSNWRQGFRGGYHRDRNMQTK
jgi:hypothetical protein